MENFQSLDPYRGLGLYYSCDYPGCKRTRNKPQRNLLQMPSGWFRTCEKDEKGDKAEKHYCLKHYNELEKGRRESEKSET